VLDEYNFRRDVECPSTNDDDWPVVRDNDLDVTDAGRHADERRRSVGDRRCIIRVNDVVRIIFEDDSYCCRPTRRTDAGRNREM